MRSDRNLLNPQFIGLCAHSGVFMLIALPFFHGVIWRQHFSKVNCSIAASQMVALMGPSGAGKTTLLNCMVGRSAGEGVIVIKCPSFLTNLGCYLIGETPPHSRCLFGSGAVLHGGIKYNAQKLSKVRASIGYVTQAGGAVEKDGSKKWFQEQSRDPAPISFPQQIP